MELVAIPPPPPPKGRGILATLLMKFIKEQKDLNLKEEF